MREYKAIISTNIKAESSGRVRTGIAGVFGNVDAVGDRLMPGSFQRTINNNAKRIKHLWNHRSDMMPVANILELREVSKRELPDAVLEEAPDATGGLLVKREYLKSSREADQLLELIDAGTINEMSFAYDVVRSENASYKNASGEEQKVRELHEVALFDTSDVNWGANSATIALGAKHQFGPFADLNGGQLPIGVIASQLRELASSVKSGRLDLSFDREILEFIHDTSAELGAACEKSTQHNELETPAEEELEPAISDSTSLLLKQNRDRLNRMRLDRLRRDTEKL
jgi:HK97 family phage prohead protease